MRFLQVDEHGDFSLTKSFINDIPLYAILSHTWAEEHEEISFADLLRDSGKSKLETLGFRKLKFCSEQATRDGLRYFWIDTCCINKSNNTELAEAINSMFKWYQNAAKCYVYLSDVSSGKHSISDERLWESTFRRSRWFTRGWTLQELIAPTSVEFFTRDCNKLGDKRSLEVTLSEITGIPALALQATDDLSGFSVEDRIGWMKRRETLRKEDMAYSMLGIFNVSLPLIYGEGKDRAMKRLLEEVEKNSKDSAPKEENRTVFMLPFSRDESFVGREDVLDQIADSVKLDSSTRHSRVALVGLGGIGKSQIAIEFAHRARTRLPGLSIMWIHASTPSRFEQGYRDFARKADIKGREDPDIHPLDLVRDWLEDESHGQWLMLLDNVDNDDDWFRPRPTLDNFGNPQRALSLFLPKSSNGTIVFTSRSYTAAQKLLYDDDIAVYVYPMPQQDSLALLSRKISYQKSKKRDAEALVHVLGGIPLAITQAAAYIKSRDRIDVSKYLEIFQENETNMATLMNNEDAGHDLRRDDSLRLSVLKTLHITIDKIHETNPKSADMLALMSMFDRQQLPKILFEKGLSSLEFEETVAQLLSYSLVHEQTEDNFGMHSLVQLAMRAWLRSRNQIWKFQSEATQILADKFPAEAILLYQNWPLCQILLPHSRELMPRNLNSTTLSEGDAVNTIKILKSCGWYLLERIGEYKGSEKFLKDAVELGERVLGKSHPMTIDCLGALGSVIRIAGWDIIAAEEAAREALLRSKTKLGPHHETTAWAQFRLGLLLARKDEYDEAESMLRLAQATFTELSGKDSYMGLLSTANLSSVLASQHKYQEAETLLGPCLESMDVVIGDEHPDTLIQWTRLAHVLEDQHKYEEAEAIYRRIVEVRERVMSPNHPRTLGTIRGLVRVLEKQEKYDETLPFKSRAEEAIKNDYDDSV